MDKKIKWENLSNGLKYGLVGGFIYLSLFLLGVLIAIIEYTIGY